MLFYAIKRKAPGLAAAFRSGGRSNRLARALFSSSSAPGSSSGPSAAPYVAATTIALGTAGLYYFEVVDANGFNAKALANVLGNANEVRRLEMGRLEVKCANF